MASREILAGGKIGYVLTQLESDLIAQVLDNYRTFRDGIGGNVMDDRLGKMVKLFNADSPNGHYEI